jgi:hypothetical protein
MRGSAATEPGEKLAAMELAHRYAIRAAGLHVAGFVGGRLADLRYRCRANLTTHLTSGQVLGIYVDYCGGFGDVLFCAVVDGGG